MKIVMTHYYERGKQAKVDQKKQKILVMAGGTGGHVFPGLAVARQMQAEGWQILWLGTRHGLEAEIVPKAGIDISYLTISAVRRAGFLAKVLAPFRLLFAFLEAVFIIRKYDPAVVLGMGGFASGPGGIAAWVLRRPLVIHEQNAIAGVTNRYLARVADRILTGFPGSFPKRIAAKWIGNPIREELIAGKTWGGNNSPPEGNSHQANSRSENSKLHVLIIGGSQGALALNQLIPKSLALIPARERPDIWHQSGSKLLNATEAAYEEAGISISGSSSSHVLNSSGSNVSNGSKEKDINTSSDILVKVTPFIDNMLEAYRWADLVVCRSGALTVAELAAQGLPSILIPFPFAVDDHQTLNGRFLEQAGAAKLIAQDALDPAKLADIIQELGRDRERLEAMSKAAQSLAKPNAASDVVNECINAAKKWQDNSLG